MNSILTTDNSTSVALSQSHIQGHHNHETDDGSHGGQIDVFVFMGLGDELFDNDINHRAGGEGQGVGKDGAHEHHEQGAQHTENRFHHTGELTVHEAFPTGEPFPSQGNGNRHAFREVLNTDTDGQGYGCSQGGAWISDGNRTGF